MFISLLNGVLHDLIIINFGSWLLMILTWLYKAFDLVCLSKTEWGSNIIMNLWNDFINVFQVVGNADTRSFVFILNLFPSRLIHITLKYWSSVWSFCDVLRSNSHAWGNLNVSDILSVNEVLSWRVYQFQISSIPATGFQFLSVFIFSRVELSAIVATTHKRLFTKAREQSMLHPIIFNWWFGLCIGSFCIFSFQCLYIFIHY